MPRNRNGKQPNVPGPDGEDLLNSINAIYEDFGCSAELHSYVTLDGRMYVEACADIAVEGYPLMHASYGRVAGGNQQPYMLTCLIVLHNLYAQIDRLQIRRVPRE